MRCNCGLGGKECDFCRIQELEDLLAAATAQRDELLRAARRASDDLDQMSRATRLQTLCVSKQLLLQAVLEPLREAIARAQPEQPQQPPTQQPMVAEPPIQSGECSFLDQLPKGPALGRFSASERAELDELKRKAFKAGEP